MNKRDENVLIAWATLLQAIAAQPIERQQPLMAELRRLLADLAAKMKEAEVAHAR
jgi:hypothetical protein